MIGFLFFVIRMGLVTAWIYEIMLSMMDNLFLLFWFPQTILHRVHVIYGPEFNVGFPMISVLLSQSIEVWVRQAWFGPSFWL